MKQDTSGYYRGDNAPLKALPGRYGLIKDTDDFYTIMNNVWCRETCSPALKDKWNSENKTAGQCSLTAFLAKEIFGGFVYGVKLENGSTHCFNVVDGHVFDFTIEQFGDDAPDLSKGSPVEFDDIFAPDEKRERFKIMKGRFDEVYNRTYNL